MNVETPEHRLKRLRMRSWRRGIKEMDLILGRYADTYLTEMSDERWSEYDSLLSENDQDLYAWVTGTQPIPERFSELIADIAEDAKQIS
jgi:antitoxin CptB